MLNRRSSFSSAATLLGVLVACSTPSRAWAQACCAGGTVITPGRLALHEDALVGVQQKWAGLLGSYDTRGHYVASSGDSEADLEQDVFAAMRLLRRGQIALLVPLEETRRATPQLGGQVGRGVGDVNLSARWDFLDAGESQWVPGVALLVGLTFPTGRPPEGATPPLFSDATGIGAYQLNAALAAEQTFGPWLANATAIVAKRTDHGGETLGTQVTLLAAGAYTFDDDMALGFSASYAFEGDATASDGSDVPLSSKHVTTATLSGLWPLTDSWRLIAGLYVNPPVDSLGSNQPATGGLSMTLLHAWN